MILTQFLLTSALDHPLRWPNRTPGLLPPWVLTHISPSSSPAGNSLGLFSSYNREDLVMAPASATANGSVTKSGGADSPPTWRVYNLIHKSSEPVKMEPPVYQQAQNGPAFQGARTNP